MASSTAASSSASGAAPRLLAFVKRGCPTCEMVAPVLRELDERCDLTTYSQDDPAFPGTRHTLDDRELFESWRREIEIVPTLIRLDDDDPEKEQQRVVGWHREQWSSITGCAGLGQELPLARPGCGSLSQDPLHHSRLRAHFEGDRLAARRIEISEAEDEMEALFERGWSDGLPVVPPTLERVLAMLGGTSRAANEVVAEVPPDLAPCTVEKAAINAVMAGCKPEYFPVVLAAVEAACTDQFNMHGLLATTMPVGPVLIVNGPIRRAIGMNSGGNVFGQGNRANSTIGRALQLIVRNVGGGRPGEVDRATFGNPSKLSFCFAEDEEGSPWGPLATDLGAPPGADVVTLFPGEGPHGVVDQLSRDPDSLCRSFAACLRTMHHPKLGLAFDAILAIGPEHARVFQQAGWQKAQIAARIQELTTVDAAKLLPGADGMAEGMPLPEPMRTTELPKFRHGGLLIVFCGGRAGLFSMIIGGWVTGAAGSQPTWREIRT